MTLVRILVDGYGLLDCCQDLAPGTTGRSESSREALLHLLTQYFDLEGVPITVVFDGKHGTGFGPDLDSTDEVTVQFSRPGQSVSAAIQCLASKLGTDASLKIVSDEIAGDSSAFHAHPHLQVQNSEAFMREVKADLAEMEQKIAQLNLRENQQFSHHGSSMP